MFTCHVFGHDDLWFTNITWVDTVSMLPYFFTRGHHPFLSSNRDALCLPSVTRPNLCPTITICYTNPSMIPHTYYIVFCSNESTDMYKYHLVFHILPEWWIAIHSSVQWDIITNIWHWWISMYLILITVFLTNIHAHCILHAPCIILQPIEMEQNGSQTNDWYIYWKEYSKTIKSTHLKDLSKHF